MTQAPSDAVLVVGGYGAVGATVSTTLAGWFPSRVIAAGRRPDRARLPSSVRTVRLDVGDPTSLDRILAEHRVRAVVLCLEPPDLTVARAATEPGATG
ncbi:NAD-dependent epimerase/dehydratase family protein [Micromonospora sp. MS34]|uniref:NAD-dependent epimerase/dehydratase family protein n=1 Tax=Micromonospora sp. MS34 TaxID=3385971 RepID=UPI0039A1C7CA